MKFKTSLLLIFFSTFVYGQNNYFSPGIKRLGICFGNSANYSGLRLNLWDSHVKKINGINISGFAESKIRNGISLGILSAQDSISNGIILGGLSIISSHHNGIAITGFYALGKKYNGLGISAIGNSVDTLNGIFFGGTGVGSDDSLGLINGIAIGGIGINTSKINGIALGAIYNSFEIQNGISISCYNSAKELHGFQFGLINHAANNPRFFRWTPFFNFNLKSNKTVSSNN